MRHYTVAVVGATGVVGHEIIEVLQELNFPVGTLKPLASERSLGREVEFKGQHIPIEVLTPDSFKGVDFALFSAGAPVSKEFAPHAVKAGAICIDNTSYFRMHDDVPLVVPEVNPDALKNHKGIIANPNCSTAQLVVALKPIYDAAGIKRIVISTYQSVSGAGKDAMDELEHHSRSTLQGKLSEPKKFAYPIAFNVIPQIDVFLDNGYTKEEMKMVNETRKILGDPSIQITATAVRVPVFVSHSESVNVETKQKISIQEVRSLMAKMPGLVVMDDPSSSKYPTPREIAGQNPVYVGRIREDISVPNGIDFWCVADNLRKGAALNAVQIAQALIGA